MQQFRERERERERERDALLHWGQKILKPITKIRMKSNINDDFL